LATSAESSGDNLHPTAPTFASTCSGVLAPAITLATIGLSGGLLLIGRPKKSREWHI
jgi:hypothetical protein